MYTAKTAPKQSWRETLTVYFQWPIIQVFLLGIASGFPLLLTGSTLSARMTEADVNIKLIGVFALIGLPYTLKFLVAPLIDAVHLSHKKSHLHHRKSWCLLTQILLVLSITGLALCDPATQILPVAIFSLLTATFSAMQDIVIDALRIEMLPQDSQGAAAAVSVTGYRIGMFVAGVGALILASYLPWEQVYLIGAGIMALAIIPTLSIRRLCRSPETKDNSANAKLENTDNTPKKKNYKAWLHSAVIEPLTDFMKRRGALIILLFIALFKLGDAMAGSLATTFYLKLGYTKIELGAITKGIGLFALLFGTFIGGFFVKRFPILKALVICGIFQILSNFVFVWLANVGGSLNELATVDAENLASQFFTPARLALATCITVENFTGGMGTAAFVAYMSQLCNIRFTATQYALLTSLSSVGRTVFSATAGFLVESMGWSWFYVSTAFFGLPGMILLYFVWKSQQTSPHDKITADDSSGSLPQLPA